MATLTLEAPRARALVPRLLLAAFVLTGFVLAGCASLGPSRDAAGWEVGSRSGEGDITLRVENENFNDARLYARWNGERRRLGTVNGLSSGEFTIPARIGSLRLEVDFIGGRGFVSGAMSVGPGDNLYFRIPSGS